MDLIIENARIPTTDGIAVATIFVDEGKIVKVKKTSQGFTSDNRIYADGLLVIPGAIDVHVHFRDFNLSYKEDFYSGSCAAIAGGVTSVFDMPNTKPVVNTSSLVEKRIKIAKHKTIINFGLHFGLPESNLEEELSKASELGIRSIKIYSYEYENFSEVLENVMKIIKENKLNLKICLHAEDRKTIEENEKKYETSVKDLEYHNLVRSEKAEENALRTTLKILEKYKIDTHVCHITSQMGVELIRKAKEEKLPITAEVTPHHLLLNLEKVKELGPIAKTNPPIRPKSTQLKLLAALISGTFDVIASDHAPHALKEKEEGRDDIRYAPPGIVGVELLLPLTFDLVSKDIISFSRFLDLLIYNPIRIFQIKNKGGLTSGFDADLTLINPKEEWIIKGENLHGRTKFTPLEGYKVRGKVVYTIVNGKVVFDNGEIIGKPGTGEFIYGD